MPRLDMIGLVCKDVKASLRFYRMLGIDVGDPEGDGDYVEATLPNGLRVSWNDVEMVKGFLDHWEEPKGQRIGMAFLCDSPAEVDQLHDAIVAAGFESHKAPWDAFWGQRYAMVNDPDGNSVDLFAPLS